jgi:membrane protease YdiL (CAAX protease family)
MDSASRRKLRAIGVALGVAVLGFVVGLVAGVVAVLVYTAITDTPVEQIGPVATLGLSFVSLQGIAFPLVAWAYLRRRGVSWDFVPASVPSPRDLLAVLGGFAAAFGGLLVVSIVLSVVEVETAPNTAGTTALENPEIIPLLIPIQFLLIGPGEELLFRGVIQGSLREHFEAPAAILLTTAMFAPGHVLALSGELSAVLATVGVLFVPSIVYGYLYERTDNIVVPALAHGLYNSTLLALLYVVATSGAAP